jgi:lipopolysaccharide biosynthesis regulator YciM
MSATYRQPFHLAVIALLAGLAPLRAPAAGGAGLPADAPQSISAPTLNPDTLSPQKVLDLHYGDVLFHFYAGDDFEALTRLEAYNQWGRMPHHSVDAELLAGGLYLELGMHNEAGRRFALLTAMKLPDAVRNRAWFYLAKIWYERGYDDRSEMALRQIQGRMGPNLDAEREHLLVNVLMRQQRFDEAIATLRGWQGAADWMAFARFNLGVALVRSQRLTEAAPILTAVGTLSTDSDELLALRDKANLALGFAYLQANMPAEATTALDRVRLNGPYSSRALLGAGWAAAASGHFREALTPWLELRGRNLLDAAVQESYLAVPYAFGKLNANAQAAEFYESALQSFAQESARLDMAIGDVRSGHLLDDILANDQDATYGWFWQLRRLPDAPQSRYLYTLLADDDFQEGLKNYRDLGYLAGTLRRWDDSMDAFGAMIETRQRAYDERTPHTDALLSSDRREQLRARRATLGAQLAAADTTGDVAALGSSEEREQWARVQRLSAALGAAAGDDPSLPEARDKLRLIKGVLYWKLDEEFKLRSYQAQRQLRELDAALNEAENRWVRVQRARGAAPSNTGDFAVRIDALGQRITALRTQLAQARSQQEHYLEDLATAALDAQKQRLGAYAVQARFALADVYDRGGDADAGTARPTQVQPAPAQPATSSAPAPAAETPP